MIKKSDIISKHVGKIIHTGQFKNKREDICLRITITDQNKENINLHFTIFSAEFTEPQALNLKTFVNIFDILKFIDGKEGNYFDSFEDIDRLFNTQDYYGKELTLYEVKYKDIELVKFLPEDHEALND